MIRFALPQRRPVPVPAGGGARERRDRDDLPHRTRRSRASRRSGWSSGWSCSPPRSSRCAESGVGVLERYRYTIATVGDRGRPCCRGCRGSASRSTAPTWRSTSAASPSSPPSSRRSRSSIFLASYLHDNRQILVTAGRRVLGLTIPPMKQFGPMLIVWGAAMGTLLLTRELGTSLMFYGAFLALLYVATGRFSFPLIGLVLFAVGALVRRRRTSATCTPACSPGKNRSTTRCTTAPAAATSSPSRCSRRPTAACSARASTARCCATPTAHSILPVPESDMIYAVIVNELGLAGAVALLLVVPAGRRARPVDRGRSPATRSRSCSRRGCRS